MDLPNGFSVRRSGHSGTVFLLKKKDFDANDLLKVFGITLIVVGTLFLISTGRSDQQIAPAMGLFGTLAGYLLGKATTTQKAAKQKEGKNDVARADQGGGS